MLSSKKSRGSLRRGHQTFHSLSKEGHKYSLAPSPILSLSILLMFILAFCLPLSADADMVFGTITDAGVAKRDSTFTIKNSKGEVVVTDMKTDNNGSYSIFLPQPGIYTVISADNKKTATILSHPEPRKQDIDLN